MGRRRKNKGIDVDIGIDPSPVPFVSATVKYGGRRLGVVTNVGRKTKMAFRRMKRL